MLVAVDAMDFHFESTCPTPYMSAPSSPRRFGNGDYYFSAPTSPARASAIYQEFNSTQRFNWDESIENPNTHDDEDEEDVDFAFDFGGHQLDRTSLTADELFDGGKIKPLLPPTNRLQIDANEFNKSRNRKSPISSPRSPRSPSHHQGKKIYPFNNKPIMKGDERDQARGRTMTSSSKSSRSRETRSLSPLRIAEFAWEEEQLQLQQEQQLQQLQLQQSSKPTSSSSSSSGAVIASSSSCSLKGSKKWSFKDLLLFRSASEGRASDKDPLRKYTVQASKRSNEDEKNSSSFRSTDSNPGSRRRAGPVSAHELHYKVNRAVAEESRRKTYLPYKPRLFGFLGFNPTVHSQRF